MPDNNTEVSKAREILDELRIVVLQRSRWLDSLLPPVFFLVANGMFGFEQATWSALALAILIGLARLLKRQPVTFALGGLGAALLAILLARFSGSAEGYFLPGILSGAATVLVALLSLVFGRPFVAWSSKLARGWPWGWYWHPQVRPAYSEVTVLWLLFFAGRLALQLDLFRAGQASLLGVVGLLTGWPALIVLLVVSYLYGTWRLRRLAGPSVQEFIAGTPPPWTGQQRGF